MRLFGEGWDDFDVVERADIRTHIIETTHIPMVQLRVCGGLVVYRNKSHADLRMWTPIPSAFRSSIPPKLLRSANSANACYFNQLFNPTKMQLITMDGHPLSVLLPLQF